MTDLFSLAGKKALITGAARGLGRAMAEALHEAGAAVAVMDVLDGMERAAAEMGRQGPPVHAFRADLGDRGQIRSAFGLAVKALGGLDILVNNAGMHVRKSVLDHRDEDWDRIVAVNMTAPFLLAQLAAPIMLAQGSGKILNVASMLAFFGGVNGSSYAATKGAVAQLTKSMSNEWTGRGICVNAIAPGYLDTDLNKSMADDFRRTVLMRLPKGHFAKPEELKGVVTFLCSPASDYISGAVIPVDGGYSAR
ncbi:MAG: SDR family oxidoreductase [Planctomycetota bacterium]|nr:SDR family oxidoreductase [Planctomycetota bacterium]